MPYPLCVPQQSQLIHKGKKAPLMQISRAISNISRAFNPRALAHLCHWFQRRDPDQWKLKKKKVFFFLKPEDTLITLRWFDVVIYSGAAANTVTVITLLWPQPLCQFGPPAARALKAANVTEPLNCDQFCLCRWRWTRSRSLRAPKSQSRANTHTHTYTCTS